MAKGVRNMYDLKDAAVSEAAERYLICHPGSFPELRAAKNHIWRMKNDPEHRKRYVCHTYCPHHITIHLPKESFSICMNRDSVEDCIDRTEKFGFKSFKKLILK